MTTPTKRACLVHSFTGETGKAEIFHDPSCGARTGWTADRWFLNITFTDGRKPIRKSTMNRATFEAWRCEFT